MQCCDPQSCGGKTLSLIGPRYWRAHYMIVFGAHVILCWVMRDYFEERADWVPGIKACAIRSCKRKQIILRVSLATCVFFTALMALTLGVRSSKTFRGRLHSAFFPAKAFLWVGLLFGFFFVDNVVLRRYFEAARAGSAVFLIMQVVAILDAVYSTNERWLERAELGECTYRLRLAMFAFVSNGGAITGIVLMYWRYLDNTTSVGFVSGTLAIFVIFTAVSLLPQVNGGLLTSGAASLYCTYLCATAIFNDPANSAPQPLWLQVIGFLIALGTLVYTAQDMGKGGEAFSVYAERGSREGEEERDEEVHPLYFSFFHFTYALGAMYAAMLFNNWSYTSVVQQYDLDKGQGSMWVKVACEWTVAVLYLWMLLAPVVGRRCCPGRDFAV